MNERAADYCGRPALLRLFLYFSVQPVLLISKRAPCRFHTLEALYRRISRRTLGKLRAILGVSAKDLGLFHSFISGSPALAQTGRLCALLPEVYIVAVNDPLGSYWRRGLKNRVD